MPLYIQIIRSRCSQTHFLYEQPVKLFLFLTCMSSNRPFPSCLKPLFQSEAKCQAIVMKMIFRSHANKTHCHNSGFALSLVLEVRVFSTLKWPKLGVAL